MDLAKRNLIAQWAYDTKPVLLRFHLWLEDVEVERNQADPVSAHSFTPRGIARSLAMTSAATALGTKLFGQFGEGLGKAVGQGLGVGIARDAGGSGHGSTQASGQPHHTPEPGDPRAPSWPLQSRRVRAPSRMPLATSLKLAHGCPR